MTGDNRASAAEMLGLSRQSLYVKLRRYGLGDLGRRAGWPPSRGTSRGPRRIRASVLELLKPITWFAPMWAFGCGVVSSGAAAGGPLAVRAGRRGAGRAAGVRHQPGRQRLVRPPRRCHQRAGPADPVGAHPRPLGPVHRHRLDRCSRSLVAPLLGAWAFGAAAGRPGARLGLQRAAAAAEAQRLVGQRRLRRLLRGPALVHRRRDHGRHGRPDCAHHRWSPRCTASARTAS